MTQQKVGQQITKFVSDSCQIKSKEVQKFMNLIQALHPHFKDLSYLRSCNNTITLKVYNSKQEQFQVIKIAYLKNKNQKNSFNSETLLKEEYELAQIFYYNLYFVKKPNKFYLFDESKIETQSANKYHGFNEKLFFVLQMEYNEFNLKEYIQKLKLENKNLSQLQKEYLIIQLLDAVNSLHQKNIIIGCLNPNNLLLTNNQKEGENQQMILKILNYGQSYYYYKYQEKSNLSCNQKYKEITQYCNEKLGEKLDIFCIGLILLELDNLNSFDIDRLTVQDYQNSGIFDVLHKFYSNKSSNLFILAQLCLLPDSSQRPSASELLQELIKMQADQKQIPTIYSLVLESQVDTFLNIFKSQFQKEKIQLDDFKLIVQELYKKDEYKGYLELIQFNQTKLTFCCCNYKKRKQIILEINLIQENIEELNLKKQIIQQVQMLNIQEFIGDYFIQIENQQFFVFEFERTECSLADFLNLQKVNNSLNKDIQQNLVYQILDAVNFAHQQYIILRNISIQSFSVIEDHKKLYPTLKLCDFSKAIKQEDASDQLNFTLNAYESIFQAPELAIQDDQIKKYSQQSDIFSVGLIICLIDNYVQLDSNIQLYSRYLKKPFQEPLLNEEINPDPINRQSELYNIIKQTLVYEPQQRKSLEQITNSIPAYQFFSKKIIQKQVQTIDQGQAQLLIPKNFRHKNKIVVKYFGDQVLVEIKLKNDQNQQLILDKSIESLSITYENQNIESLGNLWEALVQCRNLKTLSLNLSQTQITKKILHGMPEAFRWWSYNLLEFQFGFESNNADDDVLLLFAESLRYLKNLQSLNLKFSLNQISDRSFEVLCKCLQDYTQLKKILFDFSTNQLTDKSLLHFKNIIINNKDLQTLHFSFIKNNISGQCLEIFKELKQCENLKIAELDFTGNIITNNGFLGVCEMVKLQSLQTLSLIFNNTQLQETHLLNLCYSFSESHCIKNLQLRFCKTQITETVLITFSRVFQSLQDVESILVSMSNNQIQDKDFILICQSFKQLNYLKNIQLNFGYNLITLEGLQSACSELSQCAFLDSISLDLIENSFIQIGSKLTVNKVRQQINNMFKSKKFNINM
ncbi:hypothetical protein ABPG74_020532 [Tetrahymena malaccensis]